MAERILIAEEDDCLRESLASRLRRGGADVQEASDAAAAAEIINRSEIDVAVIGLVGFESDGLDLLKICRSIERPAEVILLVEKHQGSLAIKGMRLGAFRDAQLPIHVESLREIIHEAYAAGTKMPRRGKRHGVGDLSETIAAATFAEHGEFQAAKEPIGRDPGKD
jgi:DNA-binding NtrC family response regulator